MPAVDTSLETRRQIIAHLRSNAEVTAFVGQRIHAEPPANVEWPFVRYGLSDLTPFEATCWEGSEHAITLHAFSKDLDECHELCSAIVDAMSEDDIGVVDLIGIEWLSSQVTRDGDEAQAYHGIVRFTATTAG